MNLSTLAEAYPSPHEGRIDLLSNEYILAPCVVLYSASSGDQPSRVLCGADAEKLLSALEAARVA